MLKKNHGKHYLILNLSDRDYDYSIFDNRVIVCGFPDHHSPPIALMWAIYSFVDLWMAVSPQNVIAAHCLAGTGFPFPSWIRKGSHGNRDLLYPVNAGILQQAERKNNDGICERSSELLP